MAKEICGVYIGADEVRVAALGHTSRDGWTFAGGGTASLSGPEVDNPAPALRSLLKREAITATDALLCIPKDKVSLHVVTLPATEPEELRQMVRFEAERNIPFNAERHSVGQRLMRQMGVEGAEILFVAADEPVVQRVLDAIEEAKLQPRGLSVSSVSLYNALLFANRDAAITKTVAIVSIGLTSVDYVFCTEGRILYARSVPGGLQDLVNAWSAEGRGPGFELDAARIATASRMINMLEPDGDASAEATAAEAPAGSARPGDPARAWGANLLRELRLSFDYARREQGCPAIETVALCGEGSVVRNLDRYLYVNLNLEIFALNPVATIDPEMAKTFPFGGGELILPFGAAVETELEDAFRLDLIPEAHYRKVERKSLFRQVALSVVLGLVMVGLGSASFLKHRDAQSQELADYTEANALLEPRVADIREAKQKLSILEGFLDDPANANSVMEMLAGYGKIPERISLLSVSFVKGKELMFRGHAREIFDITDFEQYLVGSRWFERVEIREQTPKRALRHRPEIYVFTIRAEIAEDRADRVKAVRAKNASEAHRPEDPASGAPEAGS